MTKSKYKPDSMLRAHLCQNSLGGSTWDPGLRGLEGSSAWRGKHSLACLLDLTLVCEGLGASWGGHRRGLAAHSHEERETQEGGCPPHS